MTEIKLHNSATRRKEVFEPLDRDNVRMYVCGPTVYDRAHIGNARPAVVFDVLYRILRHVYGEDHVKYVRNITDIDDKINARGPEDFPDLSPLEGIARVTEKTTGWYLDDMKALGCLEPTEQPRATAYVPKMIEMIEALVEKGFAYAAEGHVLFEVARYEKYGALSGRSTDDMIAGARVEVAPYKRDPMDFVLWKPSSDDQPGWESPWGRGRPGWHIECSAMAKALLGETFDIHAGGADLQFPHHENEVAQSCCANETDFAKVWLHNGMVAVDGRKMSKSLGNFITMEDLRGQAPGEVLRLALLMTHYRGTLDWTERRLEQSKKTVQRWSRALNGYSEYDLERMVEAEVPNAILKALSEDLNTSKALSLIGELFRSRKDRDVYAAGAALHLIGVSPRLIWDQDISGEYDASFSPDEVHYEHPDVAAKIEELLLERRIAREQKDFEKADQIRDDLAKAGVIIHDGRNGGQWSISEERYDLTLIDEALK